MKYDFVLKNGRRFSQFEVARAKGLFRMADKGGDGQISRNEMFAMLKQVKVPITKKHFKSIFRVMDPDQSHQIEMDEWLNFMLATDEDLEEFDCGG